jgi:hypothetical protein
MIATINRAIYIGIYNSFHSRFINDKVIQSPSYVLFACPSHRREITIFNFLWSQSPKSINPTSIQKFRKTVSLFLSKPSCSCISLSILYVYFIVTYIKITAQNDSLFLRKLSQKILKISIPFFNSII